MAEYIDLEPPEGRLGRTRHLVTITTSEDVTEEVLEHAIDVYDGWFADAKQIDWERFLDQLDGYELKEHGGREIDLGSDPYSPAIKKIKRYIRRIAREV